MSVSVDGKPNVSVSMSSSGSADEKPVVNVSMSGSEDGKPVVNVSMSGSEDGKPVVNVSMSGSEDGKPAVNISMSGSEDGKPVVNISMSGSEDGKPVVHVSMSGSEDGKPIVNISMSGSADMKPGASISKSDSADLKPDIKMSDLQDVRSYHCASTSDSDNVNPDDNVSTLGLKDVNPVVRGDEFNRFEDGEHCMEALRASLLVSAEENCEQKGSVFPVTADKKDEVFTKGSSVTSCDRMEDYRPTSLVTGTPSSETTEAPAYQSPSPSLGCTDIGEERDRIVVCGQPEDSGKFGHQTGEKPLPVLKGEEQVSQDKHSRGQIPQVDPEHCEVDRVSAVEQSETRQSDVTHGLTEGRCHPSVFTAELGQDNHSPNHKNDESCLKTGSLASPSGDVSCSKSMAGRRHTKTHKKGKDSTCYLCHKRFGQRGSLLVHMRTHTDDGSASKSRIGHRYLLRHKKTHAKPKPFICDMCGKRFGQSGSLPMHMRTHTGEQPHNHDACCGERFGHRNKTTYAKKETYVSDFSGKGLRKSSRLLSHEKTLTNEEPHKYKCGVCGERFRHSAEFLQKDTLLRHESTHTGSNPCPHICNVCGEGFLTMHTFHKHKKTHTENKKPYKCDVCSKRLATKDALLNHGRIHTGVRPYMCNVCGKTFRYSCNLLEHKKIHTGDKPYKCDVCSRSFRRRDFLNNHKRIHTGEKAYKCEVCSKAFRTRYHFFLHKNRMHV